MDRWENFRSMSRWFGLAFIVICIWGLIGSLQEYSEWKAIEENGVSVQAEMVSVREYINAAEDWEVVFSYEYDGENYTYRYLNYPNDRHEGKVITAYLYADNPNVLYTYYPPRFIFGHIGIGVAGILITIYGFLGNVFKKHSKKRKNDVLESL